MKLTRHVPLTAYRSPFTRFHLTSCFLLLTLFLAGPTSAQAQAVQWQPTDTTVDGLATAIDTYFGGHTPIAYAVKSPDAVWVLASVWPPELGDGAYGPSIVMLRHAGDAFIPVSDVGRLLDSWAPTLVAWQVGPRALLLSSIGDDNSWGIITSDLSQGTLGNQVIFNVVTPAPSGGFYGDPIPHIRPSLTAGYWCLAVDTEVILFPLTSAERRLFASSASPLYFRQVARTWDMLGPCI